MRQPWLGDEAAPSGPPDLFTRESAVVPAGRAIIAYLLAVAVLVLGTTSELMTTLLDLDTWPGTDTLIAVVGALDDAARAVGLDRPHALVRRLARALAAIGS
ncbi:MAG: hypothetical protein IT561_24505 [Alphaproteobacteria bacterium]|nr:hypothetical protein [Alphaproteobacteria bacterium]